MAILGSRTEANASRDASVAGRHALGRGLVQRAAGLLLPLVAAVATGSALAAQAPSPAASEYQLKAAFLYNFARFIEWPSEAFPDPSAPILIGVLGEDPFGGDLEQMIKGKTVNGRPFVIKRFKRDQNLRACHILFISSSEQKHLAQIIEGLKGTGVLTVSEVERFAQFGGVIQLTMEASKMRFAINIDSAERARLKLSSKLLSLAKVVRDGHHAGGK
jgi:hypothetical protein